MNELRFVLDELSADAPAAEADWQDVVTRSRKTNRTRLGFAALAAAAVVMIATPAFGLDQRVRDLFGGEPVDTAQLSTQQLSLLGAMAAGANPRLSASAEETMARVGAANLRRIATRDGRSYYVATRLGGGHCVTITAASDPTPYSEYLCSAEFPSPARPVLDQSVFGGPPDAPIARRLEGFAADGVAAVELITISGSRVRTPVKDNVYAQTDGLPDEPVREIVALNAAGDRIHTALCLRRDSCA